MMWDEWIGDNGGQPLDQREEKVAALLLERGVKLRANTTIGDMIQLDVMIDGKEVGWIEV